MIKIHPATQTHLDEVFVWLKQEQEEASKGFYCKKEMIVEAFYASEMYCVSTENRIVGFAIFTFCTQGNSYIDIIEIHLSYRDKGYGKAMAQYLTETLFNSGAKNISVKCVPRSSESFWRKLGFVEREDARRWPGEALKLTL